MYSPTGYYAHFVNNTDVGDHRTTYPILRWNSDGYPVIANGGGHLVTVAAEAARIEKDKEEFAAATGGTVSGYLNWFVSPHSA